MFINIMLDNNVSGEIIILTNKHLTTMKTCAYHTFSRHHKYIYSICIEPAGGP